MYFRTPSSILIAGPSGSGKTHFVTRLLQRPHAYFKNGPINVHYAYGAWQEGFRPLQRQNVHFHEGIPTKEDLETWFRPTKGGILVLDDLMEEGGNDKRVLDLFTKDSHHRNITVLYLCQDLFPPGKYAKTISRNAHYIIAFKNPRDQTGIQVLMRQSFANLWRPALEVYNKATSRPFGYLMLDLHPASDDTYRLWTNLLIDEGPNRTFRHRREKKRHEPYPRTRVLGARHDASATPSRLGHV